METGKANPDHNLPFKDIAVQAITIHTDVTIDYNISRHAAITEAAHGDLTQPTDDMAIDLAMTHHINHNTDHPHIEALLVIDPEVIVGHIHNHPICLQDMNHVNQVHSSAGQGESHIPRRK